jgi:hypothetical protein
MYLRVWLVVALVGCSSGSPSDAGVGIDAALDGGNDSSVLVCQFSGVYIGGGCTFTLSGCSDGHQYRVNCPDPTTCDCQVDYMDAGTTTMSLCYLPSASMQLKNAINAACSWNIRD